MPGIARPKAADIIAIVVSILVTAGTAWAATASVGAETGVIVSANGKSYAYPLDEAATLDFEGPLGPTIVVIEDGEARIEESPCDEKLCVAAGAMSKSGEWAACLPNRVMVRVAGAGADTDAATY